jgi:hypothetical protein
MANYVSDTTVNQVFFKTTAKPISIFLALNLNSHVHSFKERMKEANLDKFVANDQIHITLFQCKAYILCTEDPKTKPKTMANNDQSFAALALEAKVRTAVLAAIIEEYKRNVVSDTLEIMFNEIELHGRELIETKNHAGETVALRSSNVLFIVKGNPNNRLNEIDAGLKCNSVISNIGLVADEKRTEFLLNKDPIIEVCISGKKVHVLIQPDKFSTNDYTNKNKFHTTLSSTRCYEDNVTVMLEKDQLAQIAAKTKSISITMNNILRAFNELVFTVGCIEYDQISDVPDICITKYIETYRRLKQHREEFCLYMNNNDYMSLTVELFGKYITTIKELRTTVESNVVLRNFIQDKHIEYAVKDIDSKYKGPQNKRDEVIARLKIKLNEEKTPCMKLMEDIIANAPSSICVDLEAIAKLKNCYVISKGVPRPAMLDSCNNEIRNNLVTYNQKFAKDPLKIVVDMTDPKSFCAA